MKTYKVTNKHSGEKYTLTVNFKTGTAMVLDKDSEVSEWTTWREESESLDDFIARAKKELKNDEDM